jgi:molecular chaperone GrpE (heat shock protein)
LHETLLASAVRQEDRLDELTRQIALLSDTLNAALPGEVSQLVVSSIQPGLASLEKQINRAGREQLKTNTLVEAQQAQLAESLDLLKANEAQRQAEVTALREQNRTSQTSAVRAARLEVVRGILPALDGLDDAMRSGQQLLLIYEKEKAQQTLASTVRLAEPPPPIPRPNLFARFKSVRGDPVGGGSVGGDPVGGDPVRGDPVGGGSVGGGSVRRHMEERRLPAEEKLHQGMSSWLVGLTFVRQRLLDLLAAEGVKPILAQGQPYDPMFQLVVDVVPASADFPPGTVVSEARRGYLTDNRVLRYTEVIVAQEESQSSK